MLNCVGASGAKLNDRSANAVELWVPVTIYVYIAVS